MKKRIDPLKGIKIPSEIDIEKAVRQMQKDIEKAQRDLEARAKPLYELTKEELFRVEYILAESYGHHVAPVSEMIIGGRSGSYSAGQSTRTTLTVRPERAIPVKTLIFEGPTALRKGDRISATIPRYESHGDEERRFLDNLLPRVIYTDRPYKSKEEAIEIKTFSINKGEAVRTDRSANYKRFTEK